MKKFIILSVTLFASFSTAISQVHFGGEFGVTPGSTPRSASIIINRDNPHEEFIFNMAQVKRQLYGGIRANVKLGTPFFLETGISFTRRTSQYVADYTMRRDINGVKIMNEKEDMILLPLDIGVNIGKLQITSGLTAMKTISKIKELTQLTGFHSEANSVKMGWQTGVRYAVNRTLIGVEFQGSLNRVGQGMSVNGHSLEIPNVPGKLVFSIQYRF